jgi:hypothetical protein
MLEALTSSLVQSGQVTRCYSVASLCRLIVGAAAAPREFVAEDEESSAASALHW